MKEFLTKYKHGFKPLASVAFCLILLFGALRLPGYHDEQIREKVQSKIVKVTNYKQTSGGTGFYVKAPSGHVYIMTNAHVCEVQKAGTVYIFDENLGRSLPRKVVEISGETDLCLIDAGDVRDGLELAEDYYRNEQIAVFGYPRLIDKVRSLGELFAFQVVEMPDYAIETEADLERCSLPKNFVGEVDFGFFKLPACFVRINATVTTAIILPGNSGSPAVNYYGDIIGVVFAGNDANWAHLVELKDVREFLKAY